MLHHSRRDGRTKETAGHSTRSDVYLKSRNLSVRARAVCLQMISPREGEGPGANVNTSRQHRPLRATSAGIITRKRSDVTRCLPLSMSSNLRDDRKPVTQAVGPASRTCPPAGPASCPQFPASDRFGERASLRVSKKSESFLEGARPRAAFGLKGRETEPGAQRFSGGATRPLPSFVKCEPTDEIKR
jgi:hypothetical protein